MPRYARIHVAGGLFHVISRFHGKRFYLDVDGAREKYLELLGRASQTHDCRIIAYCLMSSHVHLVLQLGNDFAQYVDAGRDEKRRPEFSGEVTKALAKRMRRLLGSDVELSYPVLGPDEFVVSVLKNQAQTHQNKRRFKAGDTSVSRLTREIFGASGINPNWARRRMRTSEVARGASACVLVLGGNHGGPKWRSRRDSMYAPLQFAECSKR